MANNQSVRRHLDALPRSNHWEVGGRPQCDKSVAAEFRIAHSIVSRLWRQFQTTGTAIRGFSSGRPRGTTPADDRRLHGGGLFARRPVRCVPLTPAHRRRRSLWCREHRNWRDNEWGRVLFTDESRFSLSSDSHRILIWRERGSRNHPSNIIERDRGAMGLQFLFMDDNAPCHRTVAAEQLLESEDIERMDWPARSPDLNPIEHASLLKMDVRLEILLLDTVERSQKVQKALSAIRLQSAWLAAIPADAVACSSVTLADPLHNNSEKTGCIHWHQKVSFHVEDDVSGKFINDNFLINESQTQLVPAPKSSSSSSSSDSSSDEIVRPGKFKDARRKTKTHQFLQSLNDVIHWSPSTINVPSGEKKETHQFSPILERCHPLESFNYKMSHQEKKGNASFSQSLNDAKHRSP
ncbi:transposable element Tcb2 transposase [Trichonephila clavipes]|nr:transposable element Tcb2 transposase [Trichonephila clavipes]